MPLAGFAVAARAPAARPPPRLSLGGSPVCRCCRPSAAPIATTVQLGGVNRHVVLLHCSVLVTCDRKPAVAKVSNLASHEGLGPNKARGVRLSRSLDVKFDGRPS